ncbi:MAG: DUF2817 domain-containing protein [Microthrixaceae bacterium]
MIPELTDYADARATVLTAAQDAGAQLSSHVHPLRGPGGEELATDVARFGAPIGEAHTVVLVNSGLHGVEGHAGNGLQQLLLAGGRPAALPPGVALVLVHAVNPYGFAWSRRVDHTNVDVNRNFVDYGALPENPRYGEVDPILNPTEMDPDDESFLAEILAFWAEVGDEAAFRTLSGGQYSHPGGVQFGGQEATWSRRTIERIWDDQLVGARSAITLDVHTGLGPLGRLTVFQTADADEPSAALGAALFPEHIYRSDRTHSIDHGLLGIGFDEWGAGRLETPTFVVEFGTFDPLQGLSVFRSDNWLHGHGDPSSELGLEIRSRMRDFFFVPEDTWRRDVAESGLEAIHRTLDAVGADEHR